MCNGWSLLKYAIALRLYWQYLGQEELDWQQITLDDLARFMLWLKVPSGSLKVLPAHPVEQARSNRTLHMEGAALISKAGRYC